MCTHLHICKDRHPGSLQNQAKDKHKTACRPLYFSPSLWPVLFSPQAPQAKPRQAGSQTAPQRLNASTPLRLHAPRSGCLGLLVDLQQLHLHGSSSYQPCDLLHSPLHSSLPLTLYSSASFSASSPLWYVSPLQASAICPHPPPVLCGSLSLRLQPACACASDPSWPGLVEPGLIHNDHIVCHLHSHFPFPLLSPFIPRFSIHI